MTPAARLTVVALATQGGPGVAGPVAAVSDCRLHAPTGGVTRVRTAVNDVLVPAFAGLTPPQIVAVSLALGLVHVAGVRMLAVVVRATAMGAVLGGLLAPMTAHACCGMRAFRYLGSAARRRAAQGV